MAKGGEGVFRCKVGAAAMGNSLYVVIHKEVLFLLYITKGVIGEQDWAGILQRVQHDGRP